MPRDETQQQRKRLGLHSIPSSKREVWDSSCILEEVRELLSHIFLVCVQLSIAISRPHSASCRVLVEISQTPPLGPYIRVPDVFVSTFLLPNRTPIQCRPQCGEFSCHQMASLQTVRHTLSPPFCGLKLCLPATPRTLTLTYVPRAGIHNGYSQCLKNRTTTLPRMNC